MTHLFSSAFEATPDLSRFIRSRMPLWSIYSPQVFLAYLEQLKLGPTPFIDFPHIVQMIQERSGFSLHPTSSLVSSERYLEQLYRKTFPIAACLRSSQHDDFSHSPDIIHDLFCHVPWLLHQDIAHFFMNMGKLFIKAVQRARVLYPLREDYRRVLQNNILAIARLCWFTVESGLIKEKEKIKVYGAAILSSTRELSHVFKSKPFISPLNVELIIHRPFYTSTLQSTFFLIQDFYELYETSELMHLFLDQGRLDSVACSSDHYDYDVGQSSYECFCS